MTTPAPAKTGFEKWQDGIDKASKNAKWDSWDCEIQMAVDEINRHLSGTSGYKPLDWQLIKAMAWVESGAAHSEWNSKPMRIGVFGDPGLRSLLSGNEGGDLILPPAWKAKLTTESVRTVPSYNIRAGVGYLLMRTANYEYKSVLAADTKVYEVTVKPGDSLDKIAKAQGSTVDTLKKLNPTATVLQPKQVLKYQKASVQRVITGWQHMTTQFIAKRYNGGGDINYATKLDYVLKAVRQREALECKK
ncbi:MAG: LysM peptidoglycan-binding domain-containing protein [Azoarcus sp.]|nr:LysM peptidoglycan-binding domain-containing protein [Azoarcus sp.]